MDDSKVIENMENFGGGFVKALAQAARKADLENLQRIKTAFPELWERYSKPRGWDKVEG